MGKRRLISILCMFLLIFNFTAAYAESIQDVNIRQLYLYSDSMHTYVDMTQPNGESIPKPEPKDIIGTLDSEQINVKNVQPFAGSGEAMAYIFVIDVSGSLSSSQFNKIKDATNKWAEKMSSNDRMAIITFGTEIRTIQDYTNNPVDIKNALNTISNSAADTKLFGAIEEAIKLVGRNDTDLPKRKAVMLLTDGVNDFNGGITEAEALKQAKESSTPFYGIWSPGTNRTVGETFMNTISDNTNGDMYNLSKKNIDVIYDEIYDSFQKSFIVDFAYPTPKADGLVHQFKINVRCGTTEANDSMECLLKPATATLTTVPVNNVSTPVSEGDKGMMSPVLLIAMIAIILIVIAVTIAVIAIINKKPVEEKRKPPVYAQYSPEDAYKAPVTKAEPAPAAAPAAPPVSKNNGMKFTLNEIGGTDVKNGSVDDSLIIGRSSSCGLQIQDSQISGKHCKLTREGDVLAIEDLGSTNGTIVNGMTISGRTKLASGDLLLLGNKEYRISF